MAVQAFSTILQSPSLDAEALAATYERLYEIGGDDGALLDRADALFDVLLDLRDGAKSAAAKLGLALRILEGDRNCTTDLIRSALTDLRGGADGGESEGHVS